jgi:hypothetical protein
MAYLWTQRTPNIQIKNFGFDWSNYSLFVLNRGWRRDSLHIMILVYICSTCSVVELKPRLETWKARNNVNGVRLFQLSYLITLIAYLCSQWTPTVQIKYFMFDCSIYRLFVLNWGWKRDSLQIMIFVYVWSTWGIFELKTRFEKWIKRYDVNGVSLFLFLFNNIMAYLCSQWTTIQNKVFYVWLVDLQTICAK